MTTQVQSSLTIEDWRYAQEAPTSNNIYALTKELNSALLKVAKDAMIKFEQKATDIPSKELLHWVSVHPIVKMYVLRMTELCFTGETIQAVADEMVVAGSIVDTMIMALENQSNG